MNYKDYSVLLLQGAMTEDFATRAMADWLNSQYEKALKVADDISEAIVADASHYQDLCDDIVDEVANIVIPDENGNLVSFAMQDVLDALHSDDPAATVSGYDPKTIINAYIESANANKTVALAVYSLLDNELSTVSDRSARFMQELSLQFGNLTETTSAYANACFNAIKQSAGRVKEVAVSLLQWIGNAVEATTPAAPDNAGWQASGASIYSACVSNLKTVGETIVQGLKKVGAFIDGIFGGLIKKVAKTAVELIQQPTGLRDAFTVLDDGLELFTNYGRNAKVLKSDVDLILGSDEWRNHVTTSRYYQMMLPAGYMVMYCDPNDDDYVYCALYTRPVNQATFKDFMGTYYGSYTDAADGFTVSPSYSSPEVIWFNPNKFGTYCGWSQSLIDQMPDCVGYYGVPLVDLDTLANRFRNVTLSSISKFADWLASDKDMMWALRAANIINFAFMVTLRQVNFYKFQDHTSYANILSADGTIDPDVLRLVPGLGIDDLFALFYAPASFSSSSSSQNNWLPRSWNDVPGWADTNLQLIILLTGYVGAAPIREMRSFRFISVTVPDPVIQMPLYYIFGEDNIVGYVNSIDLPQGKYQVYTDSELAKSVGSNLIMVAGVAAVVGAVAVAIKTRRKARTIQAAIDAAQRQSTDALAAYINNPTAETRAAARAIYRDINKYNKWVTFYNGVSSAIYGAFSQIPGFVVGRITAALQNGVSNITTLVTGGQHADTTLTEVTSVQDLANIVASDKEDILAELSAVKNLIR